MKYVWKYEQAEQPRKKPKPRMYENCKSKIITVSLGVKMNPTGFKGCYILEI